MKKDYVLDHDYGYGKEPEQIKLNKLELRNIEDIRTYIKRLMDLFVGVKFDDNIVFEDGIMTNIKISLIWGGKNKMKNDRKEKLLKILFPTDEIRNFLCNDLFQEILKEIPKSRFINANYINDDNRKLNYNLVKKDLRQFIYSNENYNLELKKYYDRISLDDLTEELIEGIIFYITNTDNRYTKVDMYNDKKSLCYTPISLVDLI